MYLDYIKPRYLTPENVTWEGPLLVAFAIFTLEAMADPFPEAIYIIKMLKKKKKLNKTKQNSLIS